MIFDEAHLLDTCAVGGGAHVANHDMDSGFAALPTAAAPPCVNTGSAPTSRPVRANARSPARGAGSGSTGRGAPTASAMVEASATGAASAGAAVATCSPAGAAFAAPQRHLHRRGVNRALFGDRGQGQPCGIEITDPGGNDLGQRSALSGLTYLVPARRPGPRRSPPPNATTSCWTT